MMDLFIKYAYRFFAEWQDTIETMPKGPDRTCHEQTLRLAKGIIKAVRMWREETSY
jgi:hypothetical protein